MSIYRKQNPMKKIEIDEHFVSYYPVKGELFFLIMEHLHQKCFCYLKSLFKKWLLNASRSHSLNFNFSLNQKSCHIDCGIFVAFPLWNMNKVLLCLNTCCSFCGKALNSKPKTHKNLTSFLLIQILSLHEFPHSSSCDSLKTIVRKLQFWTVIKKLIFCKNEYET